MKNKWNQTQQKPQFHKYLERAIIYFLEWVNFSLGGGESLKVTPPLYVIPSRAPIRDVNDSVT